MKTHEILQMTPQEFDIQMYQAFMEWAMLRTLDNKRMAQKLMQHKPIGNGLQWNFQSVVTNLKRILNPI